MRVAVAAALAVAIVSCALPAERHNLVLISLDTVRRDHLGVYGYPKPTTPVLDELAAGSAVFENATAQWTTTVPSHASMLTGLYPKTHQIFIDTRAFPAATDTLAVLLQNAGFRTGAFVSGFPMKSHWGLAPGFEVYDRDFKGLRRWGDQTLPLALAWLAGLAPEERFFLFLHQYDAHGPYRPGEEALAPFVSPDRGRELEAIPPYQQLEGPGGEPLTRLNDYVDRYDAMIGWLDELLGELFAAIDLERTVVVVVSDHGETLGERSPALNLGHGSALFEEQIAIPMILWAPGIEPGRHAAPVETVDLLPTLAELFGLSLTPGHRLEGESLVPILTGERDRRGRRFAYSQTSAFSGYFADRGYRLRDREFLRSVREARWKLILYPGVDDDYRELYDLAADPGETENLAAAHPDVRDRLEAAIRGWDADTAPFTPEDDLLPEERDQMRALGYVD